MANETGTVEQSQGQETESAQPFTSFIDDIGGEQESSTGAAEPEVEQVEGEEQNAGESEGDDANWLPSEQLKVFPPDIVARYAKRFGYTPEEIAADERLSNALSKMINSDIHIQNLSQAEQDEEEQDGEGEGEEGAEQEPTLEAPAIDAVALDKAINGFVDEVTNPEVAKKWVADLNEAVKLQSKDGGLALTKVFSRGMVNLGRDLIPAVLFQPGPDGKSLMERHMEAFLESRFEGFGQNYESTMRSQAVDVVRQSNPAYAKLPDYGTPEFLAEMQRAAEILPGFEGVVYRDKQGRPVSRQQNFKMKLSAAARLLYGTPQQKQNVVAEAKQAVETGKRIQQESARNKSLANLGAGKSKGLQPAKLTNNDDIFGAPGEVNISQKLIGRLS